MIASEYKDIAADSYKNPEDLIKALNELKGKYGERPLNNFYQEITIIELGKIFEGLNPKNTKIFLENTKFLDFLNIETHDERKLTASCCDVIYKPVANNTNPTSSGNKKKIDCNSSDYDYDYDSDSDYDFSFDSNFNNSKKYDELVKKSLNSLNKIAIKNRDYFLIKTLHNSHFVGKYANENQQNKGMPSDITLLIKKEYKEIMEELNSEIIIRRLGELENNYGEELLNVFFQEISVENIRKIIKNMLTMKVSVFSFKKLIFLMFWRQKFVIINATCQ